MEILALIIKIVLVVFSGFLIVVVLLQSGAKTGVPGAISGGAEGLWGMTWYSRFCLSSCKSIGCRQIRIWNRKNTHAFEGVFFMKDRRYLFGENRTGSAKDRRQDLYRH